MDQMRNGNGRSYVVILPKGMEGEGDKKDWPLIFINGDRDLLAYMREERLLPLTHAVSVMAISGCRQDDFTPWPGPSLNAGFPDFGGKADSWLGWIKHEVLPEVRGEYPVSGERKKTGLLGQSLGGLAALYAQTTDCCEDFGRIAAVSPSCWYPDFLARLKDGLLYRPDTSWYVSCGKAEGAESADRKKDMVCNNQKLLKFLTETQGAEWVTSYWDDGGHRDYLKERYRKAFLWLQSGF